MELIIALDMLESEGRDRNLSKIILNLLMKGPKLLSEIVQESNKEHYFDHEVTPVLGSLKDYELVVLDKSSKRFCINNNYLNSTLSYN